MSARKNKKKFTNIATPANTSTVATDQQTCIAQWLHNVLVYGLGLLGMLISLSVFSATYDTAQVKLTLLQAGACFLFGVWAALKIIQRQFPFSRKDIPFFLPLLVYTGWSIFVFICGPYHLESAEEFSRFLLYTGLTFLAATELRLSDVKTLTKFLLITAWIAILYGVLQIVDGFIKGVDPMPWRAWFSKRIFATHANPNFFGNFIIFTSAPLAAYWCIYRKKMTLCLLGLGLVCLFYTESKGAWLAYAITVAVAALSYNTNYLASKLKKHRLKINIIAAVMVVAVAVLAGVYSAKRMTSVNFRTFTWLSSFEMVRQAPIMGTGIGSFRILYPSFRRPQIFYIENAHNVETQHPENEILEQWTTNGTIGLALFLWMLVFLGALAVKTIKQTARDVSCRERNLYIWGYASAVLGIFIHNLVDISLHFASTGFFWALFIGILLALCNPRNEEIAPECNTASHTWLLWAARGFLVVSVLAIAAYICGEFKSVLGLIMYDSFAAILMAFVAGTVFVFCILCVCVVYLLTAKKLTSALALAVMWLALLPMFVAYQGFQSDHYYSLAVTFIQVGDVDTAIELFTKAIRSNPIKLEYYQLRANMLASSFKMAKIFSKERGDTTEASDDYTRALRGYKFIEKYVPNHTLLHHDKGQLFFSMALQRDTDVRQATNDLEYDQMKREALENMALAKESFQRALLIDGTYDETYIFLVQIALLENNLDDAQHWLDVYQQPWPSDTDDSVRQRRLDNPNMRRLQEEISYRKLHQAK